MRTTIDIDTPVLDDLKRLQRREGQSLGRLASDLLATAMAQARNREPVQHPAFAWLARPMGARVDLADRDAVLDAMDAVGSGDQP